MREFDDAMQDAATGARKDRHVDVLETGKRILAQDRVTVVALAINRIATVGKVRPGLVRKIFEMWLVRVREAFTLGRTLDGCAVNLLQEHDVGTGFIDTLAHGIQHEATITGTVALVDVIGEDVNFFAHK